jgi:TolB-like protein
MMRSASIALCLAVVTATMSLPERPGGSAPRKNVAVLYFDNYTGKPDYDPLGKGIASLMISDLSAVQEIQLVERDRLQDLIKEIDAQHTKYFDSTTAVKVGHMVGAEYVVVGSFTTVQPQMRIDTRVLRVETGEIVKTAQVTGDEDKFFDLEQKLADRLVDGLGIALSPEGRQALASQERANRVDRVSTLNDFSHALALYDVRDFLGAAKKMAIAVQGAPNAMFMREAYAEARRRATLTANDKVDEKKKEATDKAKDKVKSGVGGLIKRPPTP